MAIQSVDLKIPGGDTPRSAFTKVNSNFSDQSNAASRVVGESANNVMQVGAFGLGSKGQYLAAPTISEFRTNAPRQGMFFYTDAPDSYPLMRYSPAILMQATNDVNAFISVGTANRGVTASAWNNAQTDVNNYYIYTDKSSKIYQTTTASGANVVVTSEGELRRSTSSERYKDIIADLELNDDAYANAMQLAPIVYRSTAEADNPDYHYYSFSAEKLGAFDPAFTLWRDTETITDDEGNVTEQPLDKRQAEGINLNAIVAFLHATNIKQGDLIKDLQSQINELKPAPTQQPTD